MFRTAAAIGIAALVAVVALRVVFGVVGGVVGILLALAWMLLKLLIIGGIIYFAISVISPETARRIREKVGGGEAPQA